MATPDQQPGSATEKRDKDRSSQHLRRRRPQEAVETTGAPVPAGSNEPTAPLTLSRGLLLYARVRVPWFIIFVACLWMLFLMQRLLTSPCSTLATDVGTLNKATASRAFRQLAKCTHPDKYRIGTDEHATATALYTRLTGVNAAVTDQIQNTKRGQLYCYDALELIVLREVKLHVKKYLNVGLFPLLAAALGAILAGNTGYALLSSRQINLRYGAFVLLQPVFWFVIQPVTSLLDLFTLPLVRLLVIMDRYMGLIPAPKWLHSWGDVSRLPQRRNLRRTMATGSLQGPLLTHLGKPVFPIASAVVFGSIEETLFIIGVPFLIHRLPKMRQETLHLLVFAVGFLHTIIGVSSSTAYTQLSQGKGLELRWEWNLRDAILLSSIALSGAQFANISELGNEPLLCASFTAGVVLRQMGVGVPALMGVNEQTLTLPPPLRLGNMADIVTHSTRDVGACGKGGFLWIVGSYAHAIVAAQTLFLALIPLTFTLQWLIRCSAAVNATGPMKPPPSLAIQRALLGLAGAAMTVFIVTFDWNGIPNDLSGFILTALWACVFESLMSYQPVNTSGILFTIVSYIAYIVA